MNLPTRSKQAAGPRDAEESMADYAKRCWQAEFEDALANVGTAPVRDALYALWQLSVAADTHPLTLKAMRVRTGDKANKSAVE